MYLIEGSMTEVYIRVDNVFVFLPILGYDGKAPIVEFNGQRFRCQYARQKIYDAFRLDPRTGNIHPVHERKNFWYI